MYEYVVRTDGTCGDVPVGFFPAVPPRIGTRLGSTPGVAEEGAALVGDGAFDVKGVSEGAGPVVKGASEGAADPVVVIGSGGGAGPVEIASGSLVGTNERIGEGSGASEGAGPVVKGVFKVAGPVL